MKLWLDFGAGPHQVRKLAAGEFTSAHRDAVLDFRLEGDRLVPAAPGWKTLRLGAGEEKAVYAVVDSQQRVFALEVIDERGYLGGRLADGYYLADLRVPGLMTGADAASFALRPTGFARAREYVHGWEWARFRFDARSEGPLDRLLTAWLQSLLFAPMRDYRARYGDVHDRNVLFELRGAAERGVPVLARDLHGRISLQRIGLRPIDVR